MLKIETFIDFDFSKPKQKLTKISKKVSKASLNDVVKQFKENITTGKHFKDKPIGSMTKDVRRLRGISGNKPLISTGKLLNSIKKTSRGISYAAYGEAQNDGFIFRNNWNKKGGDGFYAGKGKSKTLFRVRGGTEVVDRPWIVYEPTPKMVEQFFKEFLKQFASRKRKISTKVIK